MEEKNEELRKVLKECDNLQEDNKPKKKKVTNGDKFLIVVIILIICIGLIIWRVYSRDLLKNNTNLNTTDRQNTQTNTNQNSNGGIIDQSYKPIIYIYPTQETKVTIKLGNPQKLTCTYPKYKKDGWQVTAMPDGTLIDQETGRKLYSLYWEGTNSEEFKLEQEGFCIKGEDTVKFLEEKLSLLGLNYKEQEEFIVYWLPQLEKNNYNYIRFATTEEINQNMSMEVTPTPDTIIRILMIWKDLEEPIQVKEQRLTTTQRNGFSVVEWGGTKLK